MDESNDLSGSFSVMSITEPDSAIVASVIYDDASFADIGDGVHGDAASSVNVIPSTLMAMRSASWISASFQMRMRKMSQQMSFKPKFTIRRASNNNNNT